MAKNMVWLVWYWFNDDDDDRNLFGIYSSQTKAKNAEKRMIEAAVPCIGIEEHSCVEKRIVS